MYLERSVEDISLFAPSNKVLSLSVRARACGIIASRASARYAGNNTPGDAFLRQPFGTFDGKCRAIVCQNAEVRTSNKQFQMHFFLPKSQV